MAGDSVEISPVGVIMIHNPWTYAEGDAKQMQLAAQMLDEVKESIINAYEQKTKLSREQLAQMMDDETYFRAQKAVELGFADRIMYTENHTADNLVASLSSRRQIMNCTINAIRAKVAVEQKQSADIITEPKVTTKKKRKIASLRRRLNLKYGGTNHGITRAL